MYKIQCSTVMQQYACTNTPSRYWNATYILYIYVTLKVSRRSAFCIDAGCSQV